MTKNLINQIFEIMFQFLPCQEFDKHTQKWELLFCVKKAEYTTFHLARVDGFFEKRLLCIENRNSVTLCNV